LQWLQSCANALRLRTVRRLPTEQTQASVSEAVTAAAEHAAPAVATRGEAQNEALAPTRKRRPPVRLLETDWSTERGLRTGYVPSLKRKRQQPPQPDADTAKASLRGTAVPGCVARQRSMAAPAVGRDEGPGDAEPAEHRLRDPACSGLQGDTSIPGSIRKSPSCLQSGDRQPETAGKGGTSRFRGVSWSSRSRKWRAQIWFSCDVRRRSALCPV